MLKSNKVKALMIGCLMQLGATSTLLAHGPHDHEHAHSHAVQDAEFCEKTAAAAGAVVTTGQGSFVFSWDQALTSAFPKEAKGNEPRMHGGFNEDPETNIVYTGIPGYGLCSISADLKTWKKIGTDPRLARNVHGIVFFKHKDKKFLALAQNGAQKVLVVTLEGEVVQEMGKPTGTEFSYKVANDFYKGKRSNFAVTDVTYLDGKLYAVTGYSRGDFVLTAEEKDGKWSWGKVAWGKKGKAAGEFQTAHGVYAHEDHIFVANRERHQVIKFTKDGKLVEILKDIPKGSRVCNVAYLKNHFFFCPLAPVAKGQKTAPIYAHTGDKLVSTIVPGELGIPVLRHIHHAWPHYVTDKDGNKNLYILIHGWNKGKFAVLKHEPTAGNHAKK